MGVGSQSRTKAKVNRFEEGEDERVQFWFSPLAVHRITWGAIKSLSTQALVKLRSLWTGPKHEYFQGTKTENHRMGAVAFLSNWVPESLKMVNCTQDGSFRF